MRLVALVTLALAVACGAAHPPRARPTTGGIAGLARDHDSGDPVAKAEIEVSGRMLSAPRGATSSDRGLYDVDGLAPGRYTLTATFAGQPVQIDNIDVTAGSITMVDVVFTLGRPDPIRIDFANTAGNAIDRYRPKQLATTAAIIEGTVNDSATHQRVAGAVVTAVSPATGTQQTVSDDQGRFRFETVPGEYSISAYYSVSGRGQIEVRRSGIVVAGAEAVVVPLWIETTK
ncbi:MAG TPA: carboxypeptidase-like regulatory domain-containing protein [Kofleriaceae bacterium]|nr:carboxypeptidase-like regulatory domain-containing protein [Kofleriaceae bacterium]